MKIKLFVVVGALAFFPVGLSRTLAGDMQTGAILVLVAGAILFVNYLLQIIRSSRESTLWSWDNLALSGVLFTLAILFMHGFSAAIGMMLAFNIGGFTNLYLMAGLLIPVLFLYFSIRSAQPEDKKWITIGASMGSILGIAGLLGFAQIIPLTARLSFFSWVFMLFFFLAMLLKAVLSRTKETRNEKLKLLGVALVFIGFWIFRFNLSGFMGDGLAKAILYLGFVPFIILPITILSIRKSYAFLVFIFYFIFLDFYFIQYDANFNYLVQVGTNGCEGYDQATNYPTNTDPGAPLTELLREPTRAELDEILAEWQAKDFSPKNIEVVYEAEMPNGDSIKVISHLVNDLKHYGAIRIPKGLDVKAAPILMELEGGGTGLDVSKVATLTRRNCRAEKNEFISILPSYRGCILKGADFCFRSEGYFGDPWIGPAEDAIAFLEAVKEIYGKGDDTRVLASGVSRGATVALIIGGLTEKLDYIIATSTHTKFLDQQLIENERVGSSFARAFFTPKASPGEIRKRIMASSSYYFADQLPPFDLHQGAKDDRTPVWHVEVLRDRLQRIGQDPGTYNIFIYEDKGHAYDDNERVCQSIRKFINMAN